MPVLLRSPLPIFIRRTTVRFSTSTMTSVTAMAEKMQGDKRTPYQHPNPVLRQPSHVLHLLPALSKKFHPLDGNHSRVAADT